jgi:two-component system nitrate/nitrite response regulator NarL
MHKQQKGVVVVGPSPLFREGLSRILKEAGFATLASASDIGGFILGSVWRTKSLLLVIDASGDSDSAVEQIVSFRKQYPSGRIAVLSERQRLRDALLLCRAGAHGYFAKVSTCEAFIKSLELIMLGEMIIPGLILSLMLAEDEKPKDRLVDDRQVDDRQVDDRQVDGHAGESCPGQTCCDRGLSRQEDAIVRCLVEGDSNKLIARKLRITEATVKVHVKAIFRKLGARNRTQAAIWAMRTDQFLQTARNGSGDAQVLPILVG